MKCLFLLLTLVFVTPALASDCRCEVFAVAPLTGDSGQARISLMDFKASYYGDTTLDSQRACRDECRKSAMSDYVPDVLRARLLPWLDQKVERREVGRNCTGPTDFKIPVRVRARIGDFSLGLAHQTMVFLHREKSCLTF